MRMMRDYGRQRITIAFIALQNAFCENVGNAFENAPKHFCKILLAKILHVV